MFPAPVSRESGPARKKGDASFNALMVELSAGDTVPRMKGGKAAGDPSLDSLLVELLADDSESRLRAGQTTAELLRIEMMRNSLSLADTGETPHPMGNPLIATLLAGFADNGSISHASNSTATTSCKEPSSPDTVIPAAAQPSNVSSPGVDINGLGRTASRFLGTPYRFGGEGPSGIDCSSFVQQVFREHQVSLPRTAREQITVGSEVAPGDLRKGDLVFFRTYASYPSHVGIYMGDGKMIHASSAKGKVVVSDINTNYYRSRFLGAKRVA